MGIMDKIFAKKNKKNEESAASLSKKTETVDPFIEVDTRLNQRNQSSAVQHIDYAAQEAGRRLELEMAKMEFLETHATVEEFRKAFLADKSRKELGITVTGSQSPYMKKLEVLHTYKLVSERYLSKIFLPYLIEKKDLGIISAEEQKELDAILGKTNKNEDLENATTIESYTTDFNNALVILAVIGVIKLDYYTEGKEFANGKAIRTSETNLSWEHAAPTAAAAEDLAFKIYCKQNNIEDHLSDPMYYCPYQPGTPEYESWESEVSLIKLCTGDTNTPEFRNKLRREMLNIKIEGTQTISPVLATKNALKTTPTDKVQEAKEMEQADPSLDNSKQGKTRDD